MKIIKGKISIFANFILQNFNQLLEAKSFHNKLKKAETSPIFKK